MASSTNTLKVTPKQFLSLDSKLEDIFSHFKNKKTNVLEAVFGLLQRALGFLSIFLWLQRTYLHKPPLNSYLIV